MFTPIRRIRPKAVGKELGEGGLAHGNARMGEAEAKNNASGHQPNTEPAGASVVFLK